MQTQAVWQMHILVDVVDFTLNLLLAAGAARGFASGATVIPTENDTADEAEHKRANLLTDGLFFALKNSATGDF
jgi:hypothetical protein